jgi:23S rRNA (adenine2503-C2)-methyltransferase
VKQAITDIALPDLKAFVTKEGLPSYVAKQLIIWLYRKRAATFEEMTDISKIGREKLSARCDISAVVKAGEARASDGTVKLVARARDGESFECVLLPSEAERLTACVSTQAGCAMGCGFCRTAGMGLQRNLTQGEITGQLMLLSRETESPITNIVLMGMGEPLQNREAVEGAIAVFRHIDAFNISRRRITLSTSGIVPELETFCERNDIKIAISLNATTDDVRDRLMPVNRKWPIARIMEFARNYSLSSRHRLTFEYVLLRGVNDTDDDMQRLVELLQGVSAKVNLIPFNPFEGAPFEAPLPETVERWSDALRKRGVQVNVRVSRGQEIFAACGQLAASESSDVS